MCSEGHMRDDAHTKAVRDQLAISEYESKDEQARILDGPEVNQREETGDTEHCDHIIELSTGSTLEQPAIYKFFYTWSTDHDDEHEDHHPHTACPFVQIARVAFELLIRKRVRPRCLKRPIDESQQHDLAQHAYWDANEIARSEAKRKVAGEVAGSERSTGNNDCDDLRCPQRDGHRGAEPYGAVGNGHLCLA